MSKRMLLGTLLGLLAVSSVVWGTMREQAATCSCCADCVCDQCACDAEGCACQTGGESACDSACCQTCCS